MQRKEIPTKNYPQIYLSYGQKNNIHENLIIILNKIKLIKNIFPPKINYFLSENKDLIKNKLKNPIIDYFSNISTNYL